MTMSSFQQWAARHPQAAQELYAVMGATPWPSPPDVEGRTEAGAQQQVRLAVAQAGGAVWRNNVGATPSRCKECGARQTPVRYGLANDSAKLNEAVKSADLIGVMPRVIRDEDVGRTVGQFVSIETKRPGWRYTGNGREVGQMAWATLIQQLGGYAAFSTGEVTL